MADAVTSQTIYDGSRRAVMKFTNISDGTGESAVTKVTVSALAPYNGNACTSVQILKISAMTDGMGVNILWDATTDVLCATVPQNAAYTFEYPDFGGLINNAGAGKNGNVLFTTVGASAGDRYTIILDMIKHYG
jgi:hypothetical protein